MKFGTIVVLMITLAATGHRAAAQSPAGDSFAMAAYCAASLKREVEIFNNLPTTGDAAAQAFRKQVATKMIVHIQSLLRQYTLYLLAMGDAGAAGSEGDATITELLAMQRGRAEVDQCMSETKAFEATCHRSGNCGALPPICLRQQQCEHPQDLLPFPYGQ